MKEKSIQNHRRLITATIFTFVFMTGYALSYSMIGTLLPDIITYYGVSMSQASYVNITYEIGNTAAMLLAFFFADRFDKGKVLTVLALLFGVVLLVHGSAPAFVVLLIVRVLLGMTGGLIDNICASYISDLYGEDRGRYVSILHTLYAIGSLIAPQFAAACYAARGWNLAFIIAGIAMAVAGLLAIIIFLVMGYPATTVARRDKNEKSARIPYKTIFKSRNIWWLCVASIFVMAHTYVMIWLSTYLNWLDESVYTVRFCSNIMTSMYLGMIISRLALSALSKKIGYDRYIKWAGLIAGILLAALIVIQNPIVWIVGIFIFGVISGAMYTGRIVLSCQEFPEYSSTASALTGIFGALGSMLMSYFVGLAADAGFYTQAMLVMALLIFLNFFVFTFGYKRKEEAA